MSAAPRGGEEELIRRGAPRLFLRFQRAELVKGAAVIIHGIGEHSGRYLHIMDALAARGYSTVASDLRGHGRSDGQRGHIHRFSEYLEDVQATLRWATDQLPIAKPFLIGHSLGGLIALQYARGFPDHIAGVIVSSPAIRLRLAVPAWKDRLGRLCARVAPRLAFANEVHPEHLSHDPDVAPRYAADPLVHRVITAGAFVAIDHAMRELHEHPQLLNVPALFLVAGDDRVVDASASQALVQALTCPDKQLKVYAACYHELFNELERARVVQDAIAWLDRHV